MKKVSAAIVLYLFMVCGFSFAQNIKVIGVIPKIDTGTIYQLQIGAFRLAVNVNKAKETLTRNGFTPQYEKRGNLIRVFILANTDEVVLFIGRLERAGFREVIIREYALITEEVEFPPGHGESMTEVSVNTLVEILEETLETIPSWEIEPPHQILEHILAPVP
jgi:hypothetical protein